MKKFRTVISSVTLFTLLVMTFSVLFSANKINTDVSAAEITDPLEYLCTLGIINGYPDGELHPDENLSRAEFTAILDRTYPDIAVHQVEYIFGDLDESHWAYSHIQKACNAGWLKGCDDGNFCPNASITFEQAVTVACRVAGVSPGNGIYPYDYVSAAIDNCISDGVDATIGEVVTRYEIAKIMMNVFAYEERGKTSSMIGGVKGSYSTTMGGGGAGGGWNGNYSIVTESTAALLPDEDKFMPPVTYDEEYTATDENIFKNVSTSPLSTFSIDADTASYSNVRRHILNNQKIPEGLVRTEELINYFDFADGEIEEGKAFGVGYTVAACPWNPENNLVMITVSGEELEEPKPSNIVFLVDTSGSMYSYNKLPLVKQALAMLLDKLGENDRISIVTYASYTDVVLEPTSAIEKEKILEAIDSLRAGGGTAGASGINLAYAQAEKYKVDGNNRIILCTDGDFNIGISSNTELENLIEEKRNSGIFLSVLGFGMGNYKDSKMELLADKGNGNYAYIDNLREAKKVFVDEMPKTIYTIAKDVKIQVEFNPEKVTQYRLVGYENRILNNEDFVNDQKDAGELGAGATVTVLYEIVPADGNEESALKYQNTEYVGSDELMTVKIRYKEPNGDESILEEYPVDSALTENPNGDFLFAAAVAEFGMILNESEFKGTSTFESVVDLARQGVGDDPFGIRCEFLQLADLMRYKYEMR